MIAVFGAGGDRDRGKRPLMGAIAAREADVAIVTSDNPRSEEPGAIIAEILAGIDGPPGVEVDADRRAAIRRAVGLAEPGDVLVIAGKGHEQGQEFAGGRKEPFDDVAVAREALRAVGRAREALERQPRRRRGRRGAAAPASRRPRGRRPVAGHDRLARRSAPATCSSGIPGEHVDGGSFAAMALARGRLGRAGDGGVGGRGGRGRARGGAAQPDADRRRSARWRAPGGATWPRT